MDLVLWRHADALKARDAAGLPRHELSPKGRRQAVRMAQWLDHALPAGARILVSPSLHARQTAEALDRNFESCTALLPSGSVDGLLEAARWPNPASTETVVVIGHRRMLAMVLDQVVSGGPLGQAAWRIKKGAVWWLRQQIGADIMPAVQVVAVRAPGAL